MHIILNWFSVIQHYRVVAIEEDPQPAAGAAQLHEKARGKSFGERIELRIILGIVDPN